MEGELVAKEQQEQYRNFVRRPIIFPDHSAARETCANGKDIFALFGED